MERYHTNNKGKIVSKVFEDVFSKYDLMNDLMSLGIHRLWKKRFINSLNPQKNTKLIDVASGTGDIAKLFLEKVNYQSTVCCVDENKGMLEISKKKLGGLPTLMCVNGGAMGIVTNGIHYLDLAISIFQSHPKYVISDLRNMKINPRSKALDFWEGSATWGFKNNKQLSINTSNFSNN